jgi:glycosyltransferase involved in cell wall biosynthesis
MRILVHDYVGHAFTVQLSRRLAARGHDVLHVYCASFYSPRGVMQKQADDADSLRIVGLDLGGTIPKTSFWRRFRMETAYGELLADECRRFQPDVVLSANTPSIPQLRLAKYCRSHGVRHIFWVQDIYGLAAYKLLKRRLPLVGHAVGKYFLRMDRKSARLSDALLVITEDFRPVFESWRIDPARIHVMHNWSVLGDLPVRPRENAWSRENGLLPGPRFIYSGTLAMKHNPALLLELAQLLHERGEGELIVVSKDEGAVWLEQQAAARGLRSLRSLPFQPFERLADVLGSGDVLVAILEPDAGAFSVPSKVLSYMCAGRCILAAIPRQNLAARLISECGAGCVVDPTDAAGFRQAACELLDSPIRRAEYGAEARRYAEEHFDIERISDRMEQLLQPQRTAAPRPVVA